MRTFRFPPFADAVLDYAVERYAGDFSAAYVDPGRTQALLRILREHADSKGWTPEILHRLSSK